MARALIVGCGCRGRLLGERLLSEGWEVRGTSRRPDGLTPIEAAGIEAAQADPDLPGTLLDLVGDVTVVIWALGSARGGDEAIAAIYGSRLERMLEKLVDTPVRGFVYEAAGTVPSHHLQHGRTIVELAGERWRIPVAAVTADPADTSQWVEEMLVAAQGSLHRPAAPYS